MINEGFRVFFIDKVTLSAISIIYSFYALQVY